MGLTGCLAAEMGNVKATDLLRGFPSAVKMNRDGLWGVKTAGDEQGSRSLQTPKTTHSQDAWEPLLWLRRGNKGG